MGNSISGNSHIYDWFVLYTIDDTFYFNKYAHIGNAWVNPTVRLNH